MRFVIIENGIAVNAAIAEQALADNWIASDTAAIGDLYQDGQFTTPDPVVDPEAYKEQRAREYPPIGDQLDALWKGGDAAVAMLEQVQAVKSKYPKPE
jgi:hypothetical protein